MKKTIKELIQHNKDFIEASDEYNNENREKYLIFITIITTIIIAIIVVINFQTEKELLLYILNFSNFLTVIKTIIGALLLSVVLFSFYEVSKIREIMKKNKEEKK